PTTTGRPASLCNVLIEVRELKLANCAAPLCCSVCHVCDESRRNLSFPKSDPAGYFRHVATHFSLPTLACRRCRMKLAQCAPSRAWLSGIVAEFARESCDALPRETD